ncbi:MAG: HDIG domain-containing metalloprotein [Desulfovibrionaceae bacterium]
MNASIQTTSPSGSGPAGLPFLPIPPDCGGSIPDDAACRALWDKYGMLDNVRAHSLRVAGIAQALAERAVARGLPVNVAAVRASAMLHDIAKTYTIRHGGSHAQLGASWVVAETRNRAIAQGVMLHVCWPWDITPETACCLPIFVIYADKRVRHDCCVTLQERFEDLLVRYGRNERAREDIRLAHRQGQIMETALSAQLGWDLHAHTFDSGRLV